eukprot:1657869-Prymnesium_polylepis.1
MLRVRGGAVRVPKLRQNVYRGRSRRGGSDSLDITRPSVALRSAPATRRTRSATRAGVKRDKARTAHWGYTEATDSPVDTRKSQHDSVECVALLHSAGAAVSHAGPCGPGADTGH